MKKENLYIFSKRLNEKKDLFEHASLSEEEWNRMLSRAKNKALEPKIHITNRLFSAFSSYKLSLLLALLLLSISAILIVREVSLENKVSESNYQTERPTIPTTKVNAFGDI